MAESEFLGAGPAFPFQADPGGAVMLRSGVEKVEQSIRLILATRLGERPLRPEFGCAAHQLVLEPSASPRTIGLVCRAVEDALTRWEPRIEVRSVTARPHPDAAEVLEVDVGYVVRATNDPRNLVHPFYVIRSETDDARRGP